MTNESFNAYRFETINVKNSETYERGWFLDFKRKNYAGARMFKDFHPENQNGNEKIRQV